MSKPDGALPIQDREGYFACLNGLIYSAVSGRYLKGGENPRGRLSVTLPRLNPEPGQRPWAPVDVAKIICTTFHGPRPEGMTVSHLNGNVQDNRPENLAWETWSKNHLRKHEHGTMDNGFANSRAVLTPERVERILQLRAQGRTQQRIADELGVSRTTISRVLSGRRYTGRRNHGEA